MTPWLADDSRACKGLPSLTAALPDDALACRWIVPTSLLCMVDFTMKQFHASCRTTVSIQQYRSILPDHSRHALSAFADHLCAVRLCCLIIFSIRRIACHGNWRLCRDTWNIFWLDLSVLRKPRSLVHLWSVKELEPIAPAEVHLGSLKADRC